MASIKAIEGRSVHQIQSGQVIVDLCSVVKELVENALDAGANSLDIRFKDNGLESIEVQDDGAGISADDYETIAVKHYTSKLSSYSDLSSLDTFGFRGEALSSLCALSKFHVITAKADEAPKGKRLDFEVSGQLKGTTVAACQKGTIVAVEELFYNLPVRRRELEKNIKREYKKVLDVLHAYACISTNVRFSVTHQPSKGKKAVVFSTKASPNTKDNISNIYGAKTLTALIALNLNLEIQPTTSQALKEINTGGDDSSKGVTIAGHISRPVFGEGRSTPDRQMFFVNNRPCLLPQIAKAFNEVYKSYNVTQSPFVFANLKMDTNAYDVNVSPDKRTILLHDQNSLLDALKQSLVQLFEAQEQTVPQAQMPVSKLPSYRPLTVSKEGNRIPPVVGPAIGEAVPRPNYFPSSAVADSSNVQSTEAPSTFSENGGPGGQLSKFVERNLQAREEHCAQGHDRGEGKGPSKDKQRMAKQLQEPIRESPEATASERLSQVSRPPAVSKAVEDFNARVLSQQIKSARPDFAQIVAQPDVQEEANQEPRPADTIPAIRPSPGPVQPAFDKMLPKRAPSEAVWINAGSSSSSRTVDPPAGKKRKLDSPMARGSPLAGTQSSQFAQRMHGFAAPGSQLSRTSIDAGGSDDEMTAMELGLARPSSKGVRRDQKASEDKLFVAEDPGSDQEILEVEAPNGIHSREEDDDEYINKIERRRRDEAKIAEMVRQAEARAAQPSQEQQKRAANLMKSNIRKDSTLGLVQFRETTAQRVDEQFTKFTQAMDAFQAERAISPEPEALISSKTSPEERLSLTIAKSDFADMRIIGQFNLGFILATRSSRNEHGKHSDELFIVDQHASDEIYNFSRLSLCTTLTPQPLVRPHPLELTAIEEETILSHTETLAKNGFNITLDDSGDLPVGQRCHLLTLPTSRETVFDTRDLEELISLLGEVTTSASEVVRPTKVRKMLAMRACRSSIMIGRTLTHKSMESVVRHMGEIDKPWNCPHGRPTMRHLASLGQCGGWEEGEGLVDDDEYAGGQADWHSYVKRQRDVASLEPLILQ